MQMVPCYFYSLFCVIVYAITLKLRELFKMKAFDPQLSYYGSLYMSLGGISNELCSKINHNTIFVEAHMFVIDNRSL
jgi:hypothetical protein